MDKFDKSHFRYVARNTNKGFMISSAKRQPNNASIVCREENDQETKTGKIREFLWYYVPTVEVPFFPDEITVGFILRYVYARKIYIVAKLSLV